MPTFFPRALSARFSTRLIAPRNRLANNGAAAIAAVLPESRTLLKLDMSFNSIHDMGLVALAEGMRHNHRITRLHLWGNEFGEASAAAFDSVLAEKQAKRAPLWTDFSPYPVDEHTYVAKLTSDSPFFGNRVLVEHAGTRVQ